MQALAGSGRTFHLNASIITWHGDLALTQSVKVEDLGQVWSALTRTDKGAWQVKFALAQRVPVDVCGAFGAFGAVTAALSNPRRHFTKTIGVS